MTLTKIDNRFVLRSSYDERETPKRAGFRWDPARKCWWTDQPEKAARLIDYADDTAKSAIQSIADQQTAAMAACHILNLVNN